MTDDKKRLEEIQAQQKAFKHWYDVNPKIQPQPYSESIVPTIDFLLAQIDRRDEALRFYADPESWADCSCGSRDCLYQKKGKETAIAREALGES